MRYELFEIPIGDKVIALIPLLGYVLEYEKGVKLPKYVEREAAGDSVVGKRRMAVTLVLTEDCNMACTYCYEYGSCRRKSSMKKEDIDKIFDFVLAKKTAEGYDHVSISLFGGEPSMEFELAKYVVKKAKSNSIAVELVTNGYFGKDFREFVLDNFKTVNFSIDGPSWIHDKQRPDLYGAGTHTVVSDNIKSLQRRINVKLRATITGHSQNHLMEITDHFVNEFNPKRIHLEPVMGCERAGDVVDLKRFIPDFIHVFTKYSETKRIVSTSVVNMGIPMATFCKIKQKLVFYPDGKITSCHRVNRETESDDPVSGILNIGSVTDGYEAVTKRAASVEANIRNAREGVCGICFAKYFCKGVGCHANCIMQNNSLLPANSFCETIRNTYIDLVVKNLQKKGGEKDAFTSAR
jgi:radical SAM protein with 4Fe4S-binding SPASM domain